MKNSIEKALEVLKGEYSINVQVMHPEHVSEETLQDIENSAYDVLIDATREDLEELAAEYDEDEISAQALLTTYADLNCDHFGTETTTPVVEFH